MDKGFPMAYMINTRKTKYNSYKYLLDKETFQTVRYDSYKEFTCYNSLTNQQQQEWKEAVNQQYILFDSRSECDYYAYLMLNKNNGIDDRKIAEIEIQPVFNLLPEITKNGRKHQRIDYIADFKITYEDGSIEVIDIKGDKESMTKDAKIKLKFFISIYDYHLRLIKKDNVLSWSEIPFGSKVKEPKIPTKQKSTTKKKS